MAWVIGAWTGVILASYLAGSIPTAYLVVRRLRGQDIRQLGDHNPGAGNAAAVLGAKIGAAIAAVDIGKGAVAVLLARALLDSSAAEMIAGVAAVAGHNWPVFLGGRGGRGAATAVGVFFVLFAIPALPLGLAGLAVLYLTRSATKSLAFFLILTPILLLWPFGYPYSLIAYSIGLPLMVGICHFLSVRRITPVESVRSGE